MLLLFLFFEDLQAAGFEKVGKIEADFSDEDLDFLNEEIEEESIRVADPLSLWNRGIFHFNDKFYFWVLKPVADGYKTVVPSKIRIGVKNFFQNLLTPIRFVNCILQGKRHAAEAEFARFLCNTTVGVLGFGDPAKKYYPALQAPEEDLGQTLGVYGIGNGIYIIWPFLGPSTLRDSFGLIGDHFLDPLSYVNPIESSLAIRGFDTVNATSFRIGDYEAFKESAIKPYEAFRDAYIQMRKTKLEK